MTLQLSESVVQAIRAAVTNGEAASANVFVEDAVREKLREKRRAQVYAEYELAASDPDYMRDLNAETSAFDSTLSDDSG